MHRERILTTRPQIERITASSLLVDCNGKSCGAGRKEEKNEKPKGKAEAKAKVKVSRKSKKG